MWAFLGPALSMSTICEHHSCWVSLFWCCAGMPEGWDGAALARLLADVDAEACRRARYLHTSLDPATAMLVPYHRACSRA